MGIHIYTAVQPTLVLGYGLMERYTIGEDEYVHTVGILYNGQTFTPQQSHRITKVSLKLIRVGTPGTGYLRIKKLGGDGLPAGSTLASGTTDLDTLTDLDPAEWREISLGAGTILIAGASYCILLDAKDGGPPPVEWVSWKADGSNPTYTRGNRLHSPNGDLAWTVDANRDFIFKEYGG